MPRVTLYGRFQDLAGWRERSIPASTLSELEAAIAAEAPALVEAIGHPTTQVIVNAELRPRRLLSNVFDLVETDEVAFGPPVSGG
ncbi:MoaD/ThiS family protein [Brevundimonas sp.]|uniref:MoaD/ThiS family protein n=1 Tax=Brevundimonas sp. TaxID=1871086 RepID=UPI002899E6D3|nr:MoaD/ThiS family protein [Brevundimonas sp.]